MACFTHPFVRYLRWSVGHLAVYSLAHHNHHRYRRCCIDSTLRCHSHSRHPNNCFVSYCIWHLLCFGHFLLLVIDRLVTRLEQSLTIHITYHTHTRARLHCMPPTKSKTENHQVIYHTHSNTSASHSLATNFLSRTAKRQRCCDHFPPRVFAYATETYLSLHACIPFFDSHRPTSTIPRSHRYIVASPRPSFRPTCPTLWPLPCLVLACLSTYHARWSQPHHHHNLHIPSIIIVCSCQRPNFQHPAFPANPR